MSAWFQTLKGNAFPIFDPRPSDIDIEEIAHTLAMQCRFNGHIKHFYSIAQHSVLVSKLLEEWKHPVEIVFEGLMHDAAEAYVGDVISPIKRSIPAFSDVEHMTWVAIADRYNLPHVQSPVVGKADIAMLLVEKRDLCAPEPLSWGISYEGPLPVRRIKELGWKDAKAMFLKRFAELTAKR